LRERPLVVDAYLKALRQSRKQRPPHVKESLEIYVRLWESAIRNGVVSRKDEVGDALRKIDARGGLTAAAGD